MVLDVNLSQTISELLQSRYTKEVSDSIQRLSSGLKINTSADDIGGLITSNALKTHTSILRQGIENGNEGLALIQLSNKALDNQTDILNEIKSKLELARLDSTTSNSQEAIRIDIVDLLSKFDKIASDTNYNNNYTLQNSDSDTGISIPITIIFDPNNSSSVTTQAIQSNTDALGLSDLKSLTSGQLTYSTAVTQLDSIEDAIGFIEEHKNSFRLTQSELETSVTNLTGIEKTTTASREKILNADLDKENAILDKFRLLEKSSEFAFVQANITQSIVLQLLSTSLNINPIENSDSIDQGTYGIENKDNPFRTVSDNKYEARISSNNAFENNTFSNTSQSSLSSNSDI